MLMNIILLRDFCKRTGSFEICLPRVAAFAGLTLVGIAVLALWVGFELGTRDALQQQEQTANAEMYELLRAERRAIADAKAEQRAHLDAMALKIAELQTHMIRLDAVGERLVTLGKLDTDEFDFISPPPTGGVDDVLPGNRGSASVSELSDEMTRLAQRLSDREQKLQRLEQVLVNRDLLAEITPSGRPVKKGWMSSGFGRRTDPFNGKKSYHRGVDFAGKRGSEVIAVASGIVVRSERASGYGNVVEIRHADGLVTLYGHNQENLVEEGDVVSKGQTIALLGSTGRSSGPHVHFEVHRDGKFVNPLRYVR